MEDDGVNNSFEKSNLIFGGNNFNKNLLLYCSQWTVCLTNALHYLHTSKPEIIHRDLKPSNIIITEDFQIVVIDFGVGKLCRDSTIAQTYVGTENYMAPEVLSRKSYGRTADIFSLGCILLEFFILLVRVKYSDSLKLTSSKAKAGFMRQLNEIYKSEEHGKLFTQVFSNGVKILSVYEEFIKRALDEKPLTRPTSVEIHDNLRKIRNNFKCCKDDIPDEESHSTKSSVISSDDDEFLAKFKKGLTF